MTNLRKRTEKGNELSVRYGAVVIPQSLNERSVAFRNPGRREIPESTSSERSSRVSFPGAQEGKVNNPIPPGQVAS